MKTLVTRTVRRIVLAGAIWIAALPGHAQNNPPSPPVVAPTLATAANPPAPTSQGPLTALAWDAELKEYAAKPGEANAKFTFWFTNTSPNEVLITSARSSCFCTVASLPETPWRLLPGTNNHIDVNMNLAGKVGTVEKPVIVESSAGTKQLAVRVHMPTNQPLAGFAVAPQRSEAERQQGMDKALADRQVVFKDANCIACHAEPAKNQTDGLVIYKGVCAVCHESAHRAAVVADLRSLKHETDLDYWKYWISNGRAGSMMPGFAQSEGGPLSESQITALAAYCLKTFQRAADSASQIPGVTTNAAVSPSAITAPSPPKTN